MCWRMKEHNLRLFLNDSLLSLYLCHIDIFLLNLILHSYIILNSSLALLMHALNPKRLAVVLS
jgi:hypothetical protein